MIFLVDMFHLCHRAFFSFKHLSLPDGTKTGMIYGTIKMLTTLVNKYNPLGLILCYDGGSDRRKKIYKDYKAQRAQARDGEFLQQLLILKQLFSDMGINQAYIPGEEADDIIATFSELFKAEFEVMIVSADHDFLQLVSGRVKVLKEGVNPKLYTSESVLEEFGVTPEKLLELFSIMGDESDNIKGVYKIGVKKAASLLNKYGSLDEILKSTDPELITIIKDKEIINRNIGLIRLNQGLNIPISRGECNLEIVRAIFREYLKFNQFLNNWSNIEKLSVVGKNRFWENKKEEAI